MPDHIEVTVTEIKPTEPVKFIAVPVPPEVLRPLKLVARRPPEPPTGAAQ